MTKQREINKRLAVMILVVLGMQYLPLEGYTVSVPKVAFMALAPILAIWRGIAYTKALLLGGVFFVITLLMRLLLPGEFRASTFIYTLLLVLVFHLYYGLVYEKRAFNLPTFLRVLEGLITAYFVFLLLQQVRFFTGLGGMWLNHGMYGSWKFNSLAIEPSHLARIVTVLFYAYLRSLEYYYGNSPSIKTLWKNHRRILLMLLYILLTIGSGTAYAGLGIVCLYFIRRKYLFIVVPAAFVFYMIIPYLHIDALNRAMVTFNAALTMDAEEVILADHSASSRVNIIINTINEIDFSSINTWIGTGCDSHGKIVSAIADYGLISYLFKLLFFFSCCFSSIFSLETLMFILLFSLNVGNITYGWMCLMILSTVRYFKNLKYERRFL